MNILITGGAGFVGSSIAIFLKEQHPNWNIVALDNLKRRGSELNVPRLKEHNIKFLHGDIRNKEDFYYLKKKNIDFLIECSAEPSPLGGYDGNSFYIVNTNLIGLLNCLEFCKEVNCNIIFMSTSRVYPYENINSLPYNESLTRFEWKDISGINETFPVTGAKTLYGATKFAGEAFIEEYSEMFGIKYVINRFGVIGGAWQFGKVDQGVFSLWMLSHFFKKEITYIGFGGKGKQVRDLLNVKDACSLIDIEIVNIDNLNGEIFNAGGGIENSLSLLETTLYCEKITGNRAVISSDSNNRQGDVRIYISDNKRVFERTGWYPEISKEETLNEIFLWIKDNEHLLKKSIMWR